MKEKCDMNCMQCSQQQINYCALQMSLCISKKLDEILKRNDTSGKPIMPMMNDDVSKDENDNDNDNV